MISFGWFNISYKEVAKRPGSEKGLMNDDIQHTSDNVADKQSIKTLWISKIKTFFKRRGYLAAKHLSKTAIIFDVETNIINRKNNNKQQTMSFGKHPKWNVPQPLPLLFAKSMYLRAVWLNLRHFARTNWKIEKKLSSH